MAIPGIGKEVNNSLRTYKAETIGLYRLARLLHQHIQHHQMHLLIIRQVGRGRRLSGRDEGLM